ncbi:hypothetical protein ACIQWV_24180 [Streptomyces sp. NPDC098085]|uniref:hypothetical protein n=1 Tax=unclassified Streptomyces TaxID=2593676 RepID=UPI00380214D9
MFPHVGAETKEYVNRPPQDERNQGEGAAKVLRKARAEAAGRLLLPLTVVDPSDGRDPK